MSVYNEKIQIAVKEKNFNLVAECLRCCELSVHSQDWVG